ncbi:MAG: hypothetical protein P8Y99_14550, partial [Calditrichaceae bacterium]
MKKYIQLIVLYLFLFSNFSLFAAYQSLDPANPIGFDGKSITYQGSTIPLGPKAFFIDGQLSDAETSKNPYVFNSINKAVEHLTDGTEQSPMVLYIAPYVYWIDNPDDPEIRIPKKGSTPYGLEITCNWLKFYGLSECAENIVLACNRGQTIGARGNFTLFKFSGEGTSSENITFGNYCNVDLEYPLKTELSRSKRASAIVQAQLIHCNGDRIVARNTRFISRLNLCPFVGGKRVLFDRCHFESTDDALCGSGVYLNCTFDFYSSKPFYWTRGTGAVFLNCDIRSFTRGKQYFTKANGQLAIVDTRFFSETMTYLGWRDVPPDELCNYQYNVTINGQPAFIGKNDSLSTIEMKHKPLLDAYRFIYEGKVYYNTYNLLQGNDDWDPNGIKDIVIAAEQHLQKSLTNIPVQLLVNQSQAHIETDKDSVSLSAKLLRFGNFNSQIKELIWEISPEYSSFVKLNVRERGLVCDVIPTNTTNESKKVIIKARTPSGLEAASVVIVSPSKLEPPQFITLPQILNIGNGILKVNYKLDMSFDDHSLVTWSRCTNSDGSNPIETAVSRFNQPFLEYKLLPGDVGYFIKVDVAPKHIRCDPGKAISAVMNTAISAEEVKTNPNILSTDFKNICTSNQPLVIPGFWTFDHFRNTNGNQEIDPKISRKKEEDAWYFGEGSNGCANMVGLLQTGRSASLFYTPRNNNSKNIELSMTVAPFKTAGQGFSIAPLYMDILIKFDAKTMSGYALRFIRTTKYHNAVDCILMQYKNGNIIEISEPISTNCYRTPCDIILSVEGTTLK